MDSAILISTITGAFSVSVATISLISSIISNRKNAKTNLEIEKVKATSIQNLEILKFEIEEKKNTSKIKNERKLSMVQVLDRYIVSIQILKDNLQKYIENTIDNSLLNSSVTYDMNSIASSYNSQYENEFVKLDENERIAAHKVKNIVRILNNTLIEWCDGKVYFKISEEQRDHLRNIRFKLSELQNVMRDKRNIETTYD